MNTKQVRHLTVLVAAAAGNSAQHPTVVEKSPSELDVTRDTGRPQAAVPPSKAGRRPSRHCERREILARPETLDAVCKLLSEACSLRTIAANRELFPMGISPNHLLRWFTSDPSRLEQYARAREAAADLLAEETVMIADETHMDPQCRRIRIDARKWYAGKLRPKVYGERMQQEISASLTLEEALRQLPNA